MIEKTSPTLATLFVRLCSHGGVAARDRGGTPSAFMFPAHNAGTPGISNPWDFASWTVLTSSLLSDFRPNWQK